MLDLESRMEILGITVFQDADRPNQFYYLPGPPHITHERGSPLFDLFSYRKGGESDTTLAGGFLNMTVDLGIGQLKDRIERRLRSQFGDNVTLASVPFANGTVRVIALGETSDALTGGVESETTPGGDPLVASGPRFIQNVLGAGIPSLDRDNRAIFSFSLSEEGTAFFLGVLSGDVNARPVGVIYELEYTGLLPAYDLEITIDFRSSYQYLRNRFTLGTLLFRADIDNITEELQRRESIKIREVARTLELSEPEAIRERQNRIDQLVKDLATGALFQPSLSPGRPKVAAETITATDPTGTVPAERSTSAAATALRHGPAAAVAAGLGEALNPSARERATTPGSEEEESSTTTTPSETQPTSAADVWNRLGRPQAAYVRKELTQQEQRTVTYNLTQVSAQRKTIGPQSFIQFLADARDLNQHVHIIDLNHPFFQRLNINVNAADVDFDAAGITQMTVQLRYGVRPDGTRPKDTAEIILRGTDESADFTFFMDENLTQEYEYKLIVDYRNDFGIGADELRVESRWTPTEVRSLSVHPNWLGRMLPVTVQLAPNLPQDVAEVHARVSYLNDSKLVQLNPRERTETVPIRLVDDREQYSVAIELFFTDGTSDELPLLTLPDPNSGDESQTVVINAPRANFLAGDVVMQDPFAELQTVLVDTQVLQEDNIVDSRTFELTQHGQRELISVRLPERDVAAALRWRERRIFKDGGITVDDWAEAISPNLIVGIPAADVLQVAVTYLAPKPSDLGLSGILLDLEYKDPAGDPEFEQSASMLIRDDVSTHNQEWNVRLPNRQANSYRWRMTLFFADGSRASTDFQTDNRTRLILQPPQL